MENRVILLPEDFEDQNFALNNKPLFDEYIDYVIKGHDSLNAMRLVFGEDSVSDGQFIARNFALQRNPYYKVQYAKRLSEMELEAMWNPRLAIQLLVGIARSSDKDSARINAIKELNVMTGITVMDEAGNTKMGRSLDDFYTKVTSAAESALYAPPADTKH